MRRNSILIAIVAFSVGARVIAAVALGNEVQSLPGTADQVSYHALAQRVGAGEGFSFATAWWPATAAQADTAHWSYLYTYFLAAVYALFGSNALAARLIQSVIVGVIQPLLAYAIGRRVFGETPGLLAAGITSIYAYFVYYSATLMTEPLYITSILAGMLLTIELVERAREGAPVLAAAAALGVILGATVLLRQVFLLFIPFALGWAWWASERRLRWVAVTPAAIVALMVLPFTLFNAGRFDSFVLLNTNAGYAFFWSNHPIYGTEFEPILPPEMGTYGDLIPNELRGLDEAALDRELLARGIGFVVDDPARYVALSLSRIPDFFKFWPSAQSSTISNLSRVLSFGLFLPFMLYGLIRAWLDGGRAALAGPVGLSTLFMMSYSAIHLLSWSLIRYRLPVDAVLVVFAGMALAGLARKLGFVSRAVAQPAPRVPPIIPSS